MQYTEERWFTEKELEAKRLIRNCERDLKRSLTRGEQRDLLKDNTTWDNDLIDCILDWWNGE